MTVSIEALQELPAEESGMEELSELGLRPCTETCWWWTCLITCSRTEG
jgi:hypothetical protein